MDKFDLIKKEIEEQIKKSEIEADYEHSQLTWKWVFKQKPKADAALQLAALAHDYDRSFPDRERSDHYDTYKQYKQAHAKKSAQIVTDLMLKYNFAPDEIKKVKYLIENHEIGGDGDLQTLTNADSLAYFNYNIPSYLKRNGKDKTRVKIQFMYNRLSDKAKELVNQIKYSNKEIESLVKKVPTKVK